MLAMTMKTAAVLACAVMLAPLVPAHAAAMGGSGAGGATVRHHVVRLDAVWTTFMRLNPCPATGQFTTNCPGWRVEYVVPPERGGAHEVSNLKWERTDVTRPAD